MLVGGHSVLVRKAHPRVKWDAQPLDSVSLGTILPQRNFLDAPRRSIVTGGSWCDREAGMAQATRLSISAAARLATLLLAGTLHALAQPTAPLVDPRSVAPYVPTPWHVVDRMLEIAAVSEGDVVYDLGSGDGRILLRAARDRGARGVGFEINEHLVEDAREALSAAGVQDRVEIRQMDIFKADLAPATVVTLVLMTSANRQLRPKLDRELRPGVRVASYKWEVPGWNPSKTVTVPVSGAQQPIYVYEFGQHR